MPIHRHLFFRLAVTSACLFVTLSAAGPLDIYFIDVEGGQSTLVVTSTGESLLVDTGYAGNNGRDANRIAAAARTAGLKQIDYLLLTHFHGDHAGGVPELSRVLPIRAFVDHDAIVPNDESTAPVFRAYAPIRSLGKHIVAKPGDRLPLKGVDVQIVSSDTQTIAKAVEGAGQPNPDCPSTAPAPAEAVENPRSTGIRLHFGRFTFIDLGDLSGQPLYSLFCPALIKLLCRLARGLFFGVTRNSPLVTTSLPQAAVDGLTVYGPVVRRNSARRICGGLGDGESTEERRTAPVSDVFDQLTRIPRAGSVILRTRGRC